MDQQSSVESKIARSNALLEQGHQLLAQLDADEKTREAKQMNARAQIHDAGLDYGTLQPLHPPHAPVVTTSAYPLHPYMANRAQHQHQEFPSPPQLPIQAGAYFPPSQYGSSTFRHQQLEDLHHCVPHPAQLHPNQISNLSKFQGNMQQEILAHPTQLRLTAPIMSEYPPHPMMANSVQATSFQTQPLSQPWNNAIPVPSPLRPIHDQMACEQPEQYFMSKESCLNEDQSSHIDNGPHKLNNVPFANMQGRKRSSAKPVFKTHTIPAKKTLPEQSQALVAAPGKFSLPSWYGALSKSEKQAIVKKERIFNDLVAALKEAKDNALRRGTGFDQLRTIIHQLERRDVTREALIHSKLMEQQNLPALFETEPTISFPFDIKADAKSLYTKWFRGDFSSDVERGIKTSRNAGRISHSLDKAWGFRCSAAFFGEGDLVNGQWWPNRICALRDGAHGAIEAGISGHQGSACAIVIAHSHYDDIDHGDVIHYCGTEAKEAAKPTEDTTLLLNSCYEKKPVRVLRSASLKSMFAPAKGYRYDGLYKVANYLLINRATSHYRFHLERLPDQDPIRYQGAAARPNAFEMHVALRKT